MAELRLQRSQKRSFFRKEDFSGFGASELSLAAAWLATGRGLLSAAGEAVSLAR
jgi:hypothetical protein